MDKLLFTYKGIKLVLASLVALTAVQAAMVILQAYFLADAISSLFGGDLFQATWHKLVYFFLALVIRQGCTFVKQKIVYRFANETSTSIRTAVLHKLFQLGPRFVTEKGSGQTITNMMEGTEKFQRYLELFIPKMVNTMIIPAAVWLFIFFHDSRSAIILLVAFPILIAFMILLGFAAREKSNKQYKSYQMLSNHFVDSLRGIETLKYLGVSRAHREKIRLVSERYRKNVMATLRIAFLSSFALNFITMLSIATVAVFLGLGLIEGHGQLFPALLILILAPEYFLPIREVGSDYHATLDGKEAAQEFHDILQIDTVTQQQTTIGRWNQASTLVLEKVGLQFEEENTNGLAALDFTVKGMKKIGIIGASGAGKSTLIDLLSGFRSPTAGCFMINGKRFDHLAEADWQDQITYIPQHPYIFAASLADNIRFYEPDATEEQVQAAAIAAGLTDVIASLPAGLETVVGEGGRSLSGGQEQRIALARAFLGNRPIILLDEPTAHLDIETEYALKQPMLELFQDKLVCFATHRLHWMAQMDEMVVLDGGKIVETGSHHQLMRKQGFYYQLTEAFLEGQHG